MKILQMSFGKQLGLLVFSILMNLGMLMQVMPDFQSMLSTSFFGAVLVLVGSNTLNFLLGRVNVRETQEGFETITKIGDE